MHIPTFPFRAACGLAPALLFFACNPDTSSPAASQPHEDRHHERSFSWDSPAPPALARLAARETDFADPGELARAIAGLDAALERREVSDSLWKPLDHACDELDLALWNTYGTVRVAGQLVMDEATLRARCTPLADLDDATAALGKPASSWGPQEATHRVHPYKMIGRSWDNYDLVVYKSTGAETQFKKYREKLFVTAWWDTDASRIGVRAYLFDCGIVNNARTCRHSSARTASASNDDYVAARDFSAGVKISYTFPATFHAGPTTLKAADAVLGMHSADHAGIAFRAQSSSGLYAPVTVVDLPGTSYVTW